MDDNKSLVNDDDLNQMIEGLKEKPSASATAVHGASTPAQATDAATTTSPVPNGAVAMPVPSPVPQPTQVAAPAAPPAQIAAAPIAPSGAGQPITAAAALDSIKQNALSELRPLVDKLNLSPDDKFNTLLLIIRSTDDVALLPAAHAAARQIVDEGRRAQALLDVIKEIDFFKQSAK